MKKIALMSAIATVGMSAAAVSGANISDSDTFAGDVPSSLSVTLDQFDDMGGLRTLNFVTLEIDATVGADVTGENDSDSSGQITLDLSGNANAAFGGLDATAGIATSEGPVSVAATDGTPDSGPDFHDFGTVSGTNSADDIIISGFSSFIGTGTISVPVELSGGFNISGVSDSSLGVSNFDGDGTVTITYDYTPIPEPGSMALLGLGGMGLLMRRRR